MAAVAMHPSLQPAPIQGTPYINLQAALPGTALVPDYLPLAGSYSSWNAPCPAKRTPLNSQVRPFVPMSSALSACNMAAFENSLPDEGTFRDDVSTSAETAGYLTE